MFTNVNEQSIKEVSLLSTQEKLLITPAEWEVMRVIWANGPMTSKEIQEVLEKETGWKTATTKTFIGRLKVKKALSAEKEGRQFIYSAGVFERESVKEEITSSFEKVCNRKIGTYLNDYIETTTLSQQDILLLLESLESKLDDAPVEVPCQCLEGQCNCQDCQ